MSAPTTLPITQKVGEITYELITHQDPDATHDSYLYAICQALGQSQIVAKIMKARNLDGGWEPWAQVECALALTEIFPVESIHREQAVYYGSTDLIDLWASDGGTTPAAGIEMKCRNVNFGSESAGTGLPAQMIGDMAKIGKTLKTTYPTNRVMYAIGITGNPYDLVWVRRDEHGTVGETMWTTEAPTCGAKLKWCYLYQASGWTVNKNLTEIGSVDKWKNLYLIWYKLP